MGYRPEPNSPLESIYHILYQLRQEAVFLEKIMVTKAVLDAPLQTVEGANPDNELQDISSKYLRAMFPYHEADNKKRLHDLQRVLKKWVEGVESITVQPLPTITERVRAARRIKRGREQMMKVNKQMSRMITRRIR